MYIKGTDIHPNPSSNPNPNSNLNSNPNSNPYPSSPERHPASITLSRGRRPTGRVTSSLAQTLSGCLRHYRCPSPNIRHYRCPSPHIRHYRSNNLTRSTFYLMAFYLLPLHALHGFLSPTTLFMAFYLVSLHALHGLPQRLLHPSLVNG